MKKTVRVRFAPSPTGPLHIGGVRTALYNYLFAKKNNGSFILRIEDTDQKRLVEGAEKYIVEAFRWAGIEFDEGVEQGGPYAPYKQSQRSSIYKKYVEQLIEDGHAYYAFDTPEELESLRQQFKEENKVFQYDISTRMSCRNSLSLPEAEVTKLFETATPFVVRICIPENEEIIVNDLIRGEVRVNSARLDDKVLFKADGLPTYHLANVVDDHLMGITHVIRGEEWLPSAPLHVLLYKFLKCADMPAFAHLPLILKPEGHGKLNKRDGDKHGFPVFPLKWTDPESGEVSIGYREEGYFPEAFINMLALLGWNPGTEKELFTLSELIQSFDLERVHKSGAKFDPEKTKWFNEQYLKKKSTSELAQALEKILKEKNITAPLEKIETVCALFKERVSFIHDIEKESRFVFVRPTQIDDKTARKKCKPNAVEVLTALSDFLNTCEEWQAQSLDNKIKEWSQEKGYGLGQIMLPMRLAIVGELKGPDLFDILELLGKEESIVRIQNAIPQLKEIL